MQEIMTAKVGIFRRGEDLAGGGRRAAAAAACGAATSACAYKARGANPELVTAYRVQKMLKVALCVAYGALTRTESRGAHFRQDFPRRNDAEWLKRTLATWKSDGDTLPTLAYEALDVSAMELPPGWRGYGAKDYVDHPDTPKRAAEVEALQAEDGRRAALRRAGGADALRRRCCPSASAAATSASTSRSPPKRCEAASMNDVTVTDRTRRGRRADAQRRPTAPHRKLAISVLRYNPQEPASVPRMQTYELEEADGMTLFIALNEIREKQDASLQFDFVCRAGICGSCAMVINGRPTLACRTLTKNLGAEITLAPLPFFELIGDLSVNTGKWMRGMSERLEGWLHMKEPDPDLRRIEERMDPDLADKIYELDRCIECGCCVAACGTARMREDFVGAVGLNQVARFRLDPRDARTDDDYYDVIGDDDGVFGCMSLLACHDVCPKELPLATQIAFMRRKMVTMGCK